METISDNMSQETEVTPETKHIKRKSLLGLVVLGSSIFLAGCTLSLLAPFYPATSLIRPHTLPRANGATPTHDTSQWLPTATHTRVFTG